MHPGLAGLAGLALLLLIAGCGASLADHPEAESPAEERIVSESLPITTTATEAEEATTTEEVADQEPPCTLDAADPEAVRQVAVFNRWLRDQSVGRHLIVEGLSPICGDLEGFLVVQVDLSGPAGGLDSLGRALPLYYPGASWAVLEYERLSGEGVPLRVTVETRVPAGSEPRPRCSWDPATPCPP